MTRRIGLRNIEAEFPETYKVLKPFMITDDDMRKISQAMLREAEFGLTSDAHLRSSIPCIVSYAQDLPTGLERGRYLALEMWPTNCRIMLVKFGSEQDIYMSSKCMVIPHTLAAGRGEDLFKFMADNLAMFVREKKVEKENLPMGISFGFPLKKCGLEVGVLVTWTNGFSASGVVGKDVVQLLRQALDVHKDVLINIVGIVNNSVGTLLALAWSYPNCKIGLIVGTGTNASYVEQLENCELYEGDKETPYMIINSQWNRFGENGHMDFMRNEFDKQLDAASSTPGQYYFEKCVATLYLGELVRLVTIHLMDKGLIFQEYNQDYMGIRWKMEMKSLIAVESDPPGVYTKCQEVMDKFRMRNCKEEDLAKFRFICETITARSAKLVAAGIAFIINKMNFPEISIAVDGGVYRLHPTYPDTLNKNAHKLIDPKNKFEIIVAADSAGVGAAIMAGLAYMNDNNQS